MFERFTPPARDAVVAAQHEARDLGHRHVGTEHLLLGVLTAAPDGVGARILRGLGVTLQAARSEAVAVTIPDTQALQAIGIDLESVRSKVEETFGPGALERRWRQRNSLFRRAPSTRFTHGAKQALEQAVRESLALRHNHIGTEHILLGSMHDDHEAAARILRHLNVDLDRAAMRTRILQEIDRAA